MVKEDLTSFGLTVPRPCDFSSVFVCAVDATIIRRYGSVTVVRRMHRRQAAHAFWFVKLLAVPLLNMSDPSDARKQTA